MQAVLYTNDFEPITVLDIPKWMWDRLMRGETIHIPVMRPFVFRSGGYVPPIDCDDSIAVHITGELLHRKGKRSLMLFTENDEHALLLRSDFLPGQRGELQIRERGAFARGFLDALMKTSPP